MNILNSIHFNMMSLTQSTGGGTALTGDSDKIHYTSIPGIRGWYDANYSRSYVLSSGLSIWRDKSGWGHEMTKIGVNSNPTTSTSKFGGANSFLFSGTSGANTNNGFRNSVVPLTTFASGISCFSVFLKAGTLTTDECIPACRGPSSVYGMLQGKNAARYTGNGSAGGNVNVTSGADISSYTGGDGHISGFVVSTSNFSEWVDGSNVVSQSVTGIADNGGGTGASQLCIGVAANGTSWCHNGYIAEVMFFVGALTQSQREAIEGYFALKYGLQSVLPSGHPYKTTTNMSDLSSYFTVVNDYTGGNSTSFTTSSANYNFGTTSGSQTINVSGQSNSLLNGNYVFNFQCGSNAAQNSRIAALFSNIDYTSTITFVSGQNYGTSGSAWNTYTGNKSITLWDSRVISGDYITFQFPNPIRIDQYTLIHNNNGTGWNSRYLASWVLLGSTNGSTWYLVDSYEWLASGTITQTQPTRTCCASGNGFYTYYALIGVKTNKQFTSGGGCWSLCNFRIDSATT